MKDLPETDYDAEAVRHLLSIRRLLFSLMLLTILTVAFFAREIILPVVLGILIALVLSPLIRSLKRVGLPSGISAILVMFVFASILVIGGLALRQPVTDLAANAPTIASEVRVKMRDVIQKIAEFREMGESLADMASGGGSSTAPTPVSEDRLDVMGMVTGQAVTIVSTLAAALILATFILASNDLLQRRIVEAMPRLSDKKKALGIAWDVERQISRYLGAITLINIGLGVVVGVCMWAIGLPMPAVWGVAAWLLNYLPFVGPILGMIGVGAVAVVSFDSMGQAFLAPLSYFVANAIEANVITPMLVGRRLELNTIAVFVMVMLWIWLWGIAGAFLAVPFLVVVRVLCDNVEDWQTFGRFLAADT